eukprot:SAG11_NODE_18246_length_496_cov_1.027708_1_plen_71_part_10
MMRVLDEDGSGGLDYEEFLQQFRDLEEVCPQLPLPLSELRGLLPPLTNHVARTQQLNTWCCRFVCRPKVAI